MACVAVFVCRINEKLSEEDKWVGARLRFDPKTVGREKVFLIGGRRPANPQQVSEYDRTLWVQASLQQLSASSPSVALSCLG